MSTWNTTGSSGRWVARLRRAVRFGLSPLHRLLYPRLHCNGIEIVNGRHIGPHMLDAMLRGVYEEPEISLLRDNLRPDDRLVEIGGCLGLLSAVAARYLGPGRVVSFEPNPRLWPWLLDTWQRNDVSAQLEKKAVAAEAGTAGLAVRGELWTGSLVPASSLPGQARTEVVALRDVLATYRPTALAVDVEGGEATLFQGADLSSLRMLLIEVHPRNPEVDPAALEAGFRSCGLSIHPRSTPTVQLWLRQPGAW